LTICSGASFAFAVKAGMIGSGYFTTAPILAAQAETLSTENAKENELLFTILAWCCIVTTLVLSVMICFMRHKVNVCVGILKESCKALSHIPLLMVWPLVPSIMFVALFLYWSVISAYVASAGSESLAAYADTKVAAANAVAADAASTYGNSTITFKSFETSNAQTYMAMYHLFGFLWTNQVIQAISMCTIAGAVNKYYWARDKTEMSSKPIRIGFYNAIRYHLGSLIFGSLIVAVVQFIRCVLAYIDQKTKNLQNSNIMVKIGMKCIQCCMWCLEKCLKYISKSAYIMIAMKGGSFCNSTRKAVGLLWDNMSQIALANSIVVFMLFLAEICISLLCAMAFYSLINSNEDYKEGGSKEISQPMIPVVLVALIAWFVSDKFMGLFGNIVDSTLLMFCVDKAENKGTDDGYFMSDGLAKLLGENKKAGKKAKEEAAVAAKEECAT